MNDTILKIIVETIKSKGRPLEYGMGHIVWKYELDGSYFEVDLCDFGQGRKIWMDGKLLGVVD